MSRKKSHIYIFAMFFFSLFLIIGCGGDDEPGEGGECGDLFDGGPPSIYFTNVPPKGAWGVSVSGCVKNVNQGQFYVTVFIRVDGRWWVKPFYNAMKTHFNDSGYWSARITTGGIDDEADMIRAYLLPTSFEPSSSISDGYEENAVAQVEVSR